MRALRPFDPRLVLLVLVSTLLVGCSPRAEKPAAPSEKVTIAFAALPNATLVAVAFQKGYFKEEGLEATPQMHPFGKMAMDALLEGKADFATSADTPIMFAVMNGKKIAPIAMIQTAARNYAIVARKDRGIVKPADLSGKKIGITPGTTNEFFLDYFLLTQGIPWDAVSIVAIKADDMPAALTAGTVDAVSAWNPYILQLRAMLGDQATFFVDDGSVPLINCISGQLDYVRSHPGTTQKVLRALIKAEKFVADKPAEAIALAADYIKVDKARFQEMWAELDCRVTLTQSLIVALESQTRWAIKRKLTRGTSMPNYLDYLYLDGLLAVKPDAVGIIH